MEVQSIKEIEAIENIKRYLKRNPRDYAIFIVCTNTALKIGDLRTLTVGQVRNLTPGEDLVLTGEKRENKRRITINNVAYDAIQYLLTSIPEAEDTLLLFQSRKKGNQPLTVPYLSRLIKSWCKDVGLKGNYGAQSLKKTFGYMHHKIFDVDVATLTSMVDHPSPMHTIVYGMDPEEAGKRGMRYA